MYVSWPTDASPNPLRAGRIRPKEKAAIFSALTTSDCGKKKRASPDSTRSVHGTLNAVLSKTLDLESADPVEQGG